MKRFFTLALVMTAYLSALAQKPEIFSNDKIAINGYDPVAYFTESKPVKGNTKFSTEWKEAIWQFASQKNLDAFKANPEKYTPQYGGYCAFGLSRGYKANTEADAWTIVNGKLYLNYNKDVRDEWNKDQAGYIKKADANWPTVRIKG